MDAGEGQSIKGHGLGIQVKILSLRGRATRRAVTRFHQEHSNLGRIPAVCWWRSSRGHDSWLTQEQNWGNERLLTPIPGLGINAAHWFPVLVC